MHTKVMSATPVGVHAHLVEVEVDVSLGLVNFYIVGLPDTAIKESSKRIQSALRNCGIKLPAKKITVNLAPAHLKKEGTVFDLPIAVGILVASNNLEIDKEFLQETLFLGELSLDGSIRPVKGILAIACDAKKLGKTRLIIPQANINEASLVRDIEIIGVNHIIELVAFLRSEKSIKPAVFCDIKKENDKDIKELDFNQVKGQQQAKRALQISAAGNHNIIFMGPPGSGKTMLVNRLSTIMAPLSFNEMVETSKIYSVCGKLQEGSFVTYRPVRSPHHSISQAGLIGGGSYPQPGEISLAHNGILFLDELAEFRRESIEALRQPLESHEVTISRVSQSVQFPASFLLVAALNPCPCGYLGDPYKECSCSRFQLERYMHKLSGPLLDRIDLQITVSAVSYDDAKTKTVDPIDSASLYKGVQKAQAMQSQRFGKSNYYNAQMSVSEIQEHCIYTEEAEKILKMIFDRLHVSMRGYHKILKIARTIADIDESAMIETKHIREAMMYRSIDQHKENQRNI